MPRRLRQTAEEKPPPVIHPNAVYTEPQLRVALGLNATTAAREIREGRLRYSQRAGRHYFTGAWVLEWIRGGEGGRPSAAPGPGEPQPLKAARRAFEQLSEAEQQEFLAWASERERSCDG